MSRWPSWAPYGLSGRKATLNLNVFTVVFPANRTEFPVSDKVVLLESSNNKTKQTNKNKNKPKNPSGLGYCSVLLLLFLGGGLTSTETTCGQLGMGTESNHLKVIGSL